MHRREGVLKRMVEVIAGGEKNDFGLGNHRNMLGELDKSSQGLKVVRYGNSVKPLTPSGQIPEQG
jgi:hypothetical protein